jgi:single-strand DNA-binding protein
MSLNQATILGNLGKDPEIRTLNNGDRVCNLSIATSETWKDKSTGEKKEQTEWHRVTIFNDGLAKVCEQYLKKGDTVLIQGQIKTRKWTDQQGVDKYSTEIVVSAFNGQMKMIRTGGKDGGGRDSGGGYGQQGGGYGDGRREPAGQQQSFGADLDDEIPF